MSKVSDQVYYEGAGKITMQRDLAWAARMRIYQRFLKLMTPTAETTIVDIGASDRETREANILEKHYPHPQNITCGVLGDDTELRENHPFVKIAKLDQGGKLPFADKSFDIAYSSAVLEHVGGSEDRRRFMADAVRVAKRVFFVVPNRWFPIEHHTAIPLLHWMPPLFRFVVALTPMCHWSKIENLDFVSRAAVKREWPGSAPNIEYAGLLLGPFSSNLIIVK